jgi:hypothetical protein
MASPVNVSLIARALNRFALCLDGQFHGDTAIYYIMCTRRAKARVNLLENDFMNSLELDRHEAGRLVDLLITHRYLEPWIINDVLKVSITDDALENLKEQIGE